MREVGAIDIWFPDDRHDCLVPTLVNGFHNDVPAREIFQTLGEGFTSVEHRGNLLSVCARELKETEGASRQERGLRARRKLRKELIG